MRSVRARATPSVVAASGLGAAVFLVALAIAIPKVTTWNVYNRSFPPLHADWMPRVGPTTLPVVALGALSVIFGPAFAERLRWRPLMVAAFGSALAWLLGLAFVDGGNGIGHILTTKNEYLNTARDTHNVPGLLHEYVSRIPFSSPDNWPVHIAGHPPGAVLFFVGLVRIGLGGGFAAGMVITVIAATTPVAVLSTVRVLGAEPAARRVAPILVFGPAAIWSAVSADAMFAAVVAWGLFLLAVGSIRRSRTAALGAGVLLGYAVYLSYGLVLVGVLAVTLLALTRRWVAAGWAIAGALVVTVLFTAYGFSWWHGYHVLRGRYFAGVAHLRPAAYWMWGDLAAFVFSAGPMAGASVALTLHRVHDRGRSVVGWLTLAALTCVLLADLSQLSRAEVERIWLPFAPWALLGCALLPRRWLRPALALQVGSALLIQHLFFTIW